MTQNVISYFIKYMKKEDKFKKYLDKVNKELEEKNGEHKQSEHNGS